MTKYNKAIGKKYKDMTTNKRKIYFNEEAHKYTDDLGNAYTSTTTVIGKYKDKFDADYWAKYCARQGKGKYKGLNEKQIKNQWKEINKEACEKGTKKHNYLETTIKGFTNYKICENNFINDRIYTIDDIMVDHDYGAVSLDKFITSGIKDKYPTIFQALEYYDKLGCKIYAEIGVYNYDWLISGLIDLLVVNHNEKWFVILDWKTNKKTIKFRSGYFKKDAFGDVTEDYVYKPVYFKTPLNTLEYCSGNEYSMQLSTYSKLVETFGFTYKNIHLAHIRDVNNNGDPIDETVEWYPMKYLKNHVELMIDHHVHVNRKSRNTQLFLL